MMYRIPELAPLSKRCIAVIGLGCIGAPSVLEFARAGAAELRIMDHDTIDPGNAVRWPFGLLVAGQGKAEVLRDFIHNHYPYTRVSISGHKLGEVDDDRKSDLAVLDEFLDGVDLIFDATAEVGVERLMSDLATEHKIPFVYISATPGGWGGQVARIIPGLTQGCRRCLQYSFSDGSIVLPPGDPGEHVQPAGCAAPTFTGANFDLTEISLTGVRLAVSTLCLGEKTGYPDLGWDVGILSLRDSAGRPVPPTWQTYNLDRHPKCVACATN
jgi:molybdopterin/thiamine biosynthesis adenylyltransferase